MGCCLSNKKKSDKKDNISESINELSFDNAGSTITRRTNNEKSEKNERKWTSKLIGEPNKSEQSIIISAPEEYQIHKISGPYTRSGCWSYAPPGLNETQFNNELQEQIETTYLSGKAQCEIKLDGKAWIVNYKDKLISNGSQSYPLIRWSIPEKYGWIASDGTVRPLLSDLEEMLGSDSIPDNFYCEIDRLQYYIDKKLMVMIEIESKVQRKIIII
jgi:hypothetical protein